MRTVNPRPRKINRYLRDGRSLVSRVEAGSDLAGSVKEAVDLIGGVARVIAPGDQVMVKPNFNTADPYPGRSDLEFVRVVVELLRGAGAEVTIGEDSMLSLHTREVAREVGLLDLARDLHVPLVFFDEGEWVAVRTQGKFLSTVRMAAAAYAVDKWVYLPLMKTHQSARFTLALKLTMGFPHPLDRVKIHARNIEQKIAELNLAWQPDLIVMDGRASFVTGGPARGGRVDPGAILASGDPIAIDVEALRLLKRYPARNRLGSDVWDFQQIRVAASHRLGAGSDDEIEVVGDALPAVEGFR